MSNKLLAEVGERGTGKRIFLPLSLYPLPNPSRKLMIFARGLMGW
jgi:hypothetical protein